MGGVRTNKDGAAYGLKGLYSAGEAACWDMHGFNRLGGNSLAETVVAGMVVGGKVVEFLKGTDTVFKTEAIRGAHSEQEARIKALIAGANGRENVYAVRNAMFDAIMKGAGVFRNGTDLQESVDKLTEILQRARKVGLVSNGLGANAELSLALKFEGMVKLAQCVCYAALKRTESRGAHTREDFPERNDRDWLNRTLATWAKPSDDLPTLKYEPSTHVFEIPPGERGYGGGKIIPMDNAPAAKPKGKKA
jgi:fumarate reductase flavoprotein subunit